MAIACLALKESLAPAFQDPLDVVLAIIDSADLLKGGVTTVGREHEHALCLAKNRNVWIVRDEDHLTAAPYRSESLDDRVVHEGVIKIVFRLIDQEGAFALSESVPPVVESQRQR